MWHHRLRDCHIFYCYHKLALTRKVLKTRLPWHFWTIDWTISNKVDSIRKCAIAAYKRNWTILVNRNWWWMRNEPQPTITRRCRSIFRWQILNYKTKGNPLIPQYLNQMWSVIFTFRLNMLDYWSHLLLGWCAFRCRLAKFIE